MMQWPCHGHLRTEDVLLTVQSVFMAGLINSHRRLVALRQASARMDTLGEDTNAS